VSLTITQAVPGETTRRTADATSFPTTAPHTAINILHESGLPIHEIAGSLGYTVSEVLRALASQEAAAGLPDGSPGRTPAERRAVLDREVAAYDQYCSGASWVQARARSRAARESPADYLRTLAAQREMNSTPTRFADEVDD
jgi:hypothetical protein